MIIHDVQQGSRPWLDLRCGVPTASEFSKIITPGGKISESAERYLYSLLAEKVTGEPSSDFISAWMERGNQLEDEAVAYYEFERNIDTVTVGFITVDDGSYGASPDRLVGENGLLEIKCPAPHTHVGYLLGRGADKKYMPQLQGQMLVTGRQWVDILSYCPGLPPAITRVERNEEYIATLAEELGKFCRLLANYYEQLRPLIPAKETEPDAPEFITEADMQWLRDRATAA